MNIVASIFQVDSVFTSVPTPRYRGSNTYQQRDLPRAGCLIEYSV